jgi:hypothetical protein
MASPFANPRLVARTATVAAPMGRAAGAWHGVVPVLLLGAMLGLHAAPVIAALTSQTISFAPLPDRTVGAAPFAIAATATSGLPVSFSSSSRSVCTISGNVVTVVAAGTCTIQATQNGNATYAAAPRVSQSFTVAKASQTIAFDPLADVPLGAAAFDVVATASSGLAVTLASTTRAVCTTKDTRVTLVAIGTCTLEASQAGSAGYLAAPKVTRSFGVVGATRTAQTITFPAPSDRGYGAAPFAVGATASSGLPVVVASLTSSVCTVAGDTVTLAAPGTCTLRAAQPGDGTYAPAPAVDRSFGIGGASQGIAFGPLVDAPIAASPVALSAAATSGLPVDFGSLNPSVCVVSGSSATLVAAGICAIRAGQAGNGMYAAAPSVERSFAVRSAATIQFSYDAAGNVVRMQRSPAP